MKLSAALLSFSLVCLSGFGCFHWSHAHIHNVKYEYMDYRRWPMIFKCTLDHRMGEIKCILQKSWYDNMCGEPLLRSMASAMNHKKINHTSSLLTTVLRIHRQSQAGCELPFHQGLAECCLKNVNYNDCNKATIRRMKRVYERFNHCKVNRLRATDLLCMLEAEACSKVCKEAKAMGEKRDRYFYRRRAADIMHHHGIDDLQPQCHRYHGIGNNIA